MKRPPKALEFEGDISRIDEAIRLLRESDTETSSDILNRIKSLEADKQKLLRKVYGGLTDWQVCMVARHESRPQTMDYISALFTEFTELHGDRLYADDRAIVCGLARFNGAPVMIIGHQKGSGTNARLEHNFGMPGPEGYRKVLRAMTLAEKFHLPLVSFIDTPGAYPGVGAEERGQSGAIGECLKRSATLRAPFVVVVIGEGGSGGALAMSVGDHVAVLKYSIYSVISPEGCASIIWKDANRMTEAAAMLGLTAPKLKKLGLIDEIIAEPDGGAHRYSQTAISNVGDSIKRALARLQPFSEDALLESRYNRWRAYGRCKVG